MRCVIQALVVIVVSLTAASSAFADGDTSPKNILALKVFDNRFEVQLDENHTCDRRPEDHYRVYVGAPNYDAIYSVLLSAYMTLNQVQISYRCQPDAQIWALRLSR